MLRQAFDRSRMDALLERAYVMDDGRRVFRTEDGTQVFDEFGDEVSADELDPAEILDSNPVWEEFRPHLESKIELEAQRETILDYQQQLDEAREALAEGEITEAELEEIETRLTETMPDAVRARLPEDHPLVINSELAQQAAADPTVSSGPSLDGLDGFAPNMPSPGA